MTCEEIFSELAAHMIKGMMIHEQLANYYDFLGLKGYKRCHEYHFLHESCMFRKLNRYYINHYNKLIPEKKVDDPQVIPNTWYRYTRQEVDSGTKKNAVKTGLERWVAWERETKELYQSMYQEVVNNGSIAAALFIECLIKDVDCELKKAERYHLNKLATNYDMIDIIEEQKHKHAKYKEMTEKVGEVLC